MKKRIFALILAVSIVFGSIGAVCAATFSDLSSDHWAFSAVSALVSEGTINGFEDGTFRPMATVSRAQFVKMIGKGNQTTTTDYTDVLPGDWFYDYVMTSGLDPVSSKKFEPNTPITRGDVVKLLWKRNGSQKVDWVPSIITSQCDNPDAAAWIYAKGIMMGDDYVNLRLGDSLTRAEAAALIIRARENVNATNVDFIKNVDDTVLKAVYESLDLFDNKPYDPNATVTNGELAHMAIRIAEGRHNVNYSNFTCEKPFEHKYAVSLDAYGKYCIGEDKINDEYIDKIATGADAVCAVTFGLIRTSMVYLDYGKTNDYYTDIASVSNEKVNKHLTLARNIGLSLYADGKIGADRPVTLRELTALLMQADSISGFNRAYKFTTDKKIEATSINTAVNTYPGKAKDYAVILTGISNDVYSSDYVVYADGEGVGNPKAAYHKARDYKEMYYDMLHVIAKTLNEENEKVAITYYPSMVVENGNGCTCRVKFEVIDVSDGMTLGNLIPLSNGVQDVTLTDGMTIFMDIESGQKLQNVYYTAEKANINKVVKISR